jgi:hypothetical protein
MPWDGVTAIVCTRGRRRRCAHCGGPASKLCDFPLVLAGRPATCDLPLCRHCSTPIPGDRDLCRTHEPIWDHQANRPKVGSAAAQRPPEGDAA